MHATVVDAAGSSRAAVGSWPLTTRVASPRPAFRASFELDLAPLVPTTRFAVAAAATVFEAAFRQIELDAPLSSLRGLPGGNVVACELDAPREVRTVRLAGSVSLQAGASYSLALCRLDRDVLATKPTVTATLGADRTAAIPAGFTDARFALMLQKAGASVAEPLTSASIAQIGLRSAPSAPRVALSPFGAEPDAPFWQAPGEVHTGDAAAAVHGGAALAAALQRLLDAAAGPAPTRVSVSIDSDAPCELVITAFDVSYAFVSDTFAFDVLADVDVIDGSALVTALASEVDPVSTYVRSLLSTSLQAELRQAGATPGDGLVSSIRAELDSLIRSGELYDPSRFEHVALRDETKAWLTAPGESALAIRNRLLLEDAYPGAIASPADKRVLRFPPGRIVEREAFIRLPAAVAVEAATMRTSERLRDERSTESGREVHDDVTAAKAGLHVGTDSQIAVRVMQSQSATTSGLALALLPIEPQTEVTVEIQEDWNDTPSGRVLGSGRAALHEVGDTTWATLVFDDQFVLDAKPYWLSLHATRGSAVWRTEPDDDDLRALRGDNAAGWERIRSPTGVRAVYRLFSPAPPEGAGSAGDLTVAGNAVTATAQDGYESYDLVPALNAGLTDAVPGLVSLGLRFEAVGGSITVYPPRIEYDVTTE